MIRKESVAVINESLSPHSLPDGALSAVSSHVSSHLRLLLSTASKFARHAHHLSLQAEDVQAALRTLGQPAVYGYRAASLAGLPTVWKAAGDDVYFLQDDVVDFTAVLAQPLPPPPVDVQLSVHWLAIEGVQPTLPHNTQDATQAEQKSQRQQRPPTCPTLPRLPLSLLSPLPLCFAAVAPSETKTITVPPPPPATAVPTAADEPAIAVSADTTAAPPVPHPIAGRCHSLQQPSCPCGCCHAEAEAAHSPHPLQRAADLLREDHRSTLIILLLLTTHQQPHPGPFTHPCPFSFPSLSTPRA